MKRKSREQKQQTRKAKLARLGFRRQNVEIVMAQWPGREQIDVGLTVGQYSSQSPGGFGISHDDIIEMLEEPNKLGEVAIKVGFIALAKLIGVNPAMQPEDMVQQLVKFANIDLAEYQDELDKLAILAGKKVAEQPELPLEAATNPG